MNIDSYKYLNIDMVANNILNVKCTVLKKKEYLKC